MVKNNFSDFLCYLEIGRTTSSMSTFNCKNECIVLIQYNNKIQTKDALSHNCTFFLHFTENSNIGTKARGLFGQLSCHLDCFEIKQ